jgi:hypothetical protein
MQNVMAPGSRISDLDVVELTAPAEDAPAGSRGGVLEMRPDGYAMIEVLEPVLGPAARIVFAPVSELRLVEPQPAG